MSIQERLQMVMKMNNLTAAAFADKVGVQRSSVSHVMSGRNKPSLDFIQKTLNCFPKVDGGWLVTGKPVPGSQSKERTDSQELEQDSDPIKPDQNESRAKSNQEVKTYDSSKKPDISRIIIFYSNGTFEEMIPRHQ